MLGIDAVNSPLYHLLGHRGHMGICKLYNAIAIEGRRQVSGSILDMANLKLLKTKQETIAREYP